MSQWTHVCGCIRIDALRGMGLSNSTRHEIQIQADEGLPSGSEGPLEIFIHENGNIHAVAAFAVMVIGDLRDFGADDVPRIHEWFENFTSNFGLMIRQAIIEVEVEGGETTLIRLRKE